MTGRERGEFEGRARAVLAELGYGLSERPVVLCVVDRPGWAHDRKTEALASALADRYRIVKRFQHEVTAGDLESADLLLLYYWMQVDRLGDLAATLRQQYAHQPALRIHAADGPSCPGLTSSSPSSPGPSGHGRKFVGGYAA